MTISIALGPVDVEQGLDEHDVVYVGRGEFPRFVRFYGQATTDDLAEYSEAVDQWIMQQISGVWEVYDAKSLTRPKFAGNWTIGLPKFVYEDADAAMMWMMMNLSE